MDKHTHDDLIGQINAIQNVTVADWLANRSTLDAGPNFNIDDTAANISAAFNKLNSDDHITQIIISDNASIVLNVGKLVSDTDALSKLINSDNSAATVTVKDTAQHIGTSFATIGADAQVTSIVVSDNGVVTLTGAQVQLNGAAIDELVNGDATAAHVTVKDSAANIAATIDSYGAHLSTITSIVVSNSAAMTLTAGEIANDAAVLAEVTNNNGNPVTFNVADSGANIGLHLDALEANTQIGTITDTNNSAIGLNIAQFTSDIDALNKVQNADNSPVSFIVTDTAAHIAGDFDNLSGNSQVTKIIVSDSGSDEVTITAAQAGSDTAALNELFLSGGTAHAHVAVSDTAAHISAAIDALNSNTHVNTIFISPSGTLTLNATQVANDTTALGEISGSYTINVTDTAAHITANLTALEMNGHVVAIVVSDNAEITVSIAQLASDSAVISELTNQNADPVHVIVSDTAANIVSAITSLNGNALVNKIIVSDSATHEVTISVAQAAADGTVLGELYLADGVTQAHVAVSDTAANIASALDTLNNNFTVDKIIVSNSDTHEVTISAEMAVSDAAALGELYLSDGVTAAHVAVSDTAANISDDLSELSSNGHVDKITITDSGTPLSMDIATMIGDAAGLAKITGGYSINITDTAAQITANLDTLDGQGHVTKVTVSDSNEVQVSVAQLTSDAAILGELFNSDGTTYAHVQVSDTAAIITGAIDALDSNSQVNKILVSDSATHEVTITAAQAAADTAVLGELYSADGSSHVDVAVSDTASNISLALDDLSLNTNVDKIIVNDSGTNEVSVDVAQLTSDATALNELFAADGLSQAHVVVTDTAVSITTALDTLNGDTQVDKIVVNNSRTTITEVQVSVAQITSDAHALAELYNSDGVTQAKIAVVDGASAISAALNALNGNGQVDHIIISDNGAINVNASQALSDSVALGELSNADHSPVTLIVTDTAATISADLNLLNADANISSVVISDSAALTLNAGQITSDASILAKLSNFDSSGVQIDVVDTALNISHNLDALKANNDIVSITVSDSAPITVTVAQITTDAVVLSELVNADSSPITLTVNDTVANIRMNLASLNQNSEITSIVISDNRALQLTVAQFNADAHALSILHNANGNPYALKISDSAAHISASLDALAGNMHVTSLIVTDSAAIALNVGQITSDAALLSHVTNANASPYTLNVTDTAADISNAIGVLDSNSHVTKIVVSDSATHEVSISAVQLASDTALLSKLFDADGTTPAHVDVSGTATDVSSTLNILEVVNGQIDTIIVTDSGSHEVTISIAQITSDADVLAKLYNADGSAVANVQVSDTASNISLALTTLAGDTQVNKVIVNDGADVVVTVAQITSDAIVLAELFKADGQTQAQVTVQDTAENVTTALDTLNGNSQVDKIEVAQNLADEVTVNVAQLTSDAHALSELFYLGGSAQAKIAVSDTAANIATAFNALNANSQVNEIYVSDGNTNEVTLTAFQATHDAVALSELYLGGTTMLANVRVSDTAAHISASFDALAGLSQLDKIVVTDSSSNEVTITVAQVAADNTLLSELVTADGTTQAHIEVSDTAADVSAAIVYLNNHSQIDHIVISDGNPLTLTVAQLVNDTTALGKIVGPYGVNVSDTGAHIRASLDALEVNPNVVLVTVTDNAQVIVSIAQLTSDANVLSVMVDANGQQAALRILDTAANIQANLGNLTADTFNHNIGSIVISDNGSISLSASQFEIDAPALALLHNQNGSTVQLALSDTAANVASIIDGIQAFNLASNTDHVTSITITNNTAMTLTAAQIQNDASVLAEVVNRNGSPVSFKVVDTGADISSSLDALQANSHVSSITVSDNAAITLTLAQLTADAAVLATLHNADASPYKLDVSGTAANLTSNLHALGMNAHVQELIVSDSTGGHEVAFNVSQLTNDAHLFGEIFNSDGTTEASLKLVDNAAHLQALTATQIQGLAADNFNVIDSSTNKLVFSLAQYEALGTVHLTQSDVVTLSDTASGFAGLSAADITALSTNGVDKVVMSGFGDFSAAQWNAFGGVAVTNNGTIEIDGTAGSDTITVGKGTFILSAGGGGDILTVGAGHDTFIYGSSAESTGTGFDTIHGFNAQTDSFQLSSAVTGIDHAVSGGQLDLGANFDTELTSDLNGHLNADHALLFTATSGSLSGHTFLVVDTNGVAGYQNGDLVIDVTGGLHGLNLSDFTQGV